MLSNEECPCFSCCFTKFNKSKAFDCKKCHIKTNLRLNLVNPDKDEDIHICGFCNTKGFFDSFGTIFEEEKNIELLKIKYNDNILNDYQEQYKNNIIKDFKMMRLRLRKERIRRRREEKKERNKEGEEEEDEEESADDGDGDNENLIEDGNVVKFFSEHEEEFSTTKLYENLLFNKFLFYQDLVYKNSFLFLKINFLNFMKVSNEIHNGRKEQNLNASFRCFVLSLIDRENLRDGKYVQFVDNLVSFYEKQKIRMYSLNSDIYIDEKTIKYFYFMEFYINFLFSSNWEVVKLIIDDKVNWQVRYKALKILALFGELDDNLNVFQNYAIKLIGKLLTDNSFHIREFSFELLFKLFQKGKISKNKLIEVLYANINETSFCIRNRAVKELANLVYQSKDKETLKPILYIYFEKLQDESESLKIKNRILEFFTGAFNNCENMLNLFLETLIEIFIENEKSSENCINIFEVELSNLLEKINQKVKTFTQIFDYFLNNYLLSPKIIEKKGLKEQLNFISILTLVKIISKYDADSVAIYINTFYEVLGFNSEIQEHNNKALVLGIEIISNLIMGNNRKNNRRRNKFEGEDDEDTEDEYMEESTSKILIKNEMYKNIHLKLQDIMYKKMPMIAYKALDVIYIMIKQGQTSILPLFKFCGLNYNFLKKCMNNPVSIINNPISVTVKSLGLFCKIINKLSAVDIMSIFHSLFNSADEVSDEIFKLLTVYFNFKFDYKKILNLGENDIREEYEEKLRGLSLKTFDCFCIFWTKYPKYLRISEDIFNKSLGNMNTNDEKLSLIESLQKLIRHFALKCNVANDKNSGKDTEGRDQEHGMARK